MQNFLRKELPLGEIPPSVLIKHAVHFRSTKNKLDKIREQLPSNFNSSSSLVIIPSVYYTRVNYYSRLERYKQRKRLTSKTMHICIDAYCRHEQHWSQLADETFLREFARSKPAGSEITENTRHPLFISWRFHCHEPR